MAMHMMTLMVVRISMRMAKTMIIDVRGFCSHHFLWNAHPGTRNRERGTHMERASAGH